MGTVNLETIGGINNTQNSSGIFNRENLNVLLKQYQTYTEKRIELEKKYNEEIATLEKARMEAEREGNKQQLSQINASMAQAIKKRGEELMKFDYNQLKDTPEYGRAFHNLSQTSTETLNSLLEQFKRVQQESANMLSSDQLKEYVTNIQKLSDELENRNPFQALATHLEERKEAQGELNVAKQQLNDVNAGKQIVTHRQYNQKSGKIDVDYLSAADAVKQYNAAQDKVVKKNAQIKEDEKKIQSAITQLSTSLKGLGSTIGGLGGEILSSVGDIMTFTMTAMNGVDTVSQASASAIQKVEKASVILAVIGTAIQLMMKLTSLFSDDGTEEYERAAKAYDVYIKTLDKVIDKQKELFALNSQVGDKAFDDAEGYVKSQSKLAIEMGKNYLNTGASWKSHSNGIKQKDDISKSAWNELKSALGHDTYRRIRDGRMTALFDLTPDQIRTLQSSATTFYSQLNSDTQKYLSQILACDDALKQLEIDRKKGLTGTEYGSFMDSFLDILKNLDSSSKDFADSFEDYLRNAILSSLITNNYADRIRNLYNSWAKYTESGHKLDEREVEVLQAEQQKIVSDMLADREELMKTFGWTSESSQQQSGRSGSFTTMSQEQGTKLEGLFTSVQDHVSSIDTTVFDISRSMYEASDSLAAIVRNTGYCYHLEQMAEDISELKRDGIKMK